MRYWCWLILFLSRRVAGVQAQSTGAKRFPGKYNTRNIDNNNGQNSNDVYALTQGKNGYINTATPR